MLQPKPLFFNLRPTQYVDDVKIRKLLLEEGCPIVLHPEERDDFLAVLRNDTNFLAKMGFYG